LTSRWMWRKEVTTIAEIINKALSNFEDESLLTKLSNEIKSLCKKFPVPSI
jgi:glycine/serine hydroxymethyltransferase